MLQGFVLEMLKRKKAEILEISKRDGAVDSHEREIKCLGLSFSFNVNYASFLYKCHEVAEKGQSCKYERSNFGELMWECTVPISVICREFGNTVSLKKR